MSLPAPPSCDNATEETNFSAVGRSSPFTLTGKGLGHSASSLLICLLLDR